MIHGQKKHQIIIIIIVSFMQGSHTHIPETNHVPRGYIVADICLCCLWCQYVYFLRWFCCSFTLALSEVCVQCPIWLFSIAP